MKNPDIKFKPEDLDRELIVEMLKRFSLYEISVKFGIKYNDLVDRCVKLSIRDQLNSPENDRFSKADKICRRRGFEGAVHYIQKNGVVEFMRKIKPLIS